MNRLLLILLVGVALVGCEDLGVEPEPGPTNPPIDSHGSLVAGVVGVFFTSGTTLEQAQQLVKDLGLSFKFPPAGTPLNGVVLVPTGSEDQWILKFKTYPIVKTADRIAVTWTT